MSGMRMDMRPKLQTKQVMVRRVVVGIGVVGTLVIAGFFGANMLKSTDSMASSSLCGSTVTSTTTISSDLNCSSDITVDGSTLYVHAAVDLNGGKLEVKQGGVVYIKNGGSLDAKDIVVKEGSELIVSGNVNVDEEFKVENNNSKVVINQGYKVLVDKKFEFKDESIVQVAGEFEFTGKDESKVKDGCKLQIDASGTFKYNSTDKKMKFENGGDLSSAGTFTSTKKVEFKEAEVDFLAGSKATFSSDLKIEESSTFDVLGKVTVEGKVELKKYSEFNLVGTFEVPNNKEFKMTEEGVLKVKNHGTLRLAGKFKVEHNKTKVEVNPGGWLIAAEFDVKNDSEFDNDGYVEHTNAAKKVKFDKVKMTGDGVFYCLDQSKLDFKNGAEILGKSKNDFSSDQFVVGNTTISVKRLPKFKIEEDGWTLGDTLVVTDTLNLNGKSMDIKTHDFRLPKSFSYRRTGNNSEYIRTSSTGRYKLRVLQNNTEHVAPIGRNPYLPVTASCEDCEGAEFAVSVTEGVFLDPDAETVLQTSDIVGETWSVIPNQTFAGDVTFTVQWNAGGSGTTNSEEFGFNRSSVTSYYWVSGQSSDWETDGTHVNQAAGGSDPYEMSITISGMTAGTEYFIAVGSDGTALPVEFTYFKATEAKGTVSLEWETATELNNDFFQVQHSVDAMTWTDLEKIQGAGTSITANTYNAYDYYPESGINYYRIKQVDFDGTTDYSEVRMINLGASTSGGIQLNGIYPNPFTDYIKVEYTAPAATEVSVELLDLNGNRVYQRSELLREGNSNLMVNGLSRLARGQYVLRLVSGEVVLSEKALKQ